MDDRDRKLLDRLSMLVLLVTTVVVVLTVVVVIQTLTIHQINKTDHAQNTSIRALRR